MKVAISVADNNGLESKVDPRFGRAVGFLVVDQDTNELEYHSNEQNLNAAQGAGIQAAGNVAKTGVCAVITANCGPKAFQVLQANGIRVFLGTADTVRDVLAKLEANELDEASAANVNGHWST